jgi:putative transposase
VSRGTFTQMTANVFDMTKVVKRAYKYRFYPTPEQAAELSRTFGCVRKVWNLALQARTTAWHQRHERVTYLQSSAMLTQWKRSEDLTFLAEVSCVPLQQALRHLQSAYARFWHKQARYPRYKSRKKSRSAAEYTRSAFRYRDGQLRLAKMTAPLNVVWSRPLPDGAEPSTVTVSRDRAGRWFVSLLCQCAVEPHPASDEAVGIDAGITSLVTLSTGRRSPTPGTSAATGTGSRGRSGGWPAPGKAPRTGTRPVSNSPGSTPASPTGGKTFCISSRPGSSATAKRS